MERAKYFIICFLMFLHFAGVKASSKSAIYTAYVLNNMKDWQRIIDQMETIETKSNNLLLELVNYQYGYIAWCIGNNRNEEAGKYLDKAEKNITLLAKRNCNPTMVNAYKAAFYGYRIGLNTFLAPFFGPKSVASVKLSLEQDPNNSFGYIQYGNIMYYMPAIFGGSKTEALQSYIKAKNLMEKNSQDIYQNWNYLNLLALIAQAYSDLNDCTTARVYFDTILKQEPEFGWVKNELYPQLLKKMED
jgi:hypothetical protein